MSGIAGFVGVDGRPPDPRVLAPVLDLLAPLGGAGRGEWSGSITGMGVDLGVERRRRVPEDVADRQPVVAGDGTVVVVADLVLDNRAELCARLRLADRRDLTDTGILAAAYLRWGPGCVDHLIGDFAFAVADAHRGGLLLARDPMGLRPLHVARGRGWMGFATTALALTGLAAVPAEPDLTRVQEYLALVMASHRSWIAGVEQVPAGTVRWVAATGERDRRYWPAPGPSTPAPGSFESHTEALRGAFDTAVAGRMRSTGGIGVSLSGGLDSTAVAAAAARLVAPEPVRTYTSVPPPGWAGRVRTGVDADERPQVEALAACHPNLVPTFLDSRGASFFEFYDELFAAGATPPRNVANLTWIQALHRTAAADGVTLLLTGNRGNLSWSIDNPRWLVDRLTSGRSGTVLAEARSWASATGLPMATVLRRFVLRPLAPVAWQDWRSGVGRRRYLRRGAATWQEHSGLRPERLAALPLAINPFVHHPEQRGDVRDLLAIDIAAAQAEFTAVESARWGLRFADPTADIRVAEAALRQPRGLRRHQGHDRALARAAMRDLVPDAVRLRRPRGAQLPDWADRVHDARDEIRVEFEATCEHALSRSLLDVDRLGTIVARLHGEAEPGGSPVDQHIVLLRSLLASRYLRTLDGRAEVRRTRAVPR